MTTYEELTKRELGLACHLARAQLAMMVTEIREGHSSDLAGAKAWRDTYYTAKSELFRRRWGRLPQR